jgi:hypothetical protein
MSGSSLCQVIENINVQPATIFAWHKHAVQRVLLVRILGSLAMDVCLSFQFLGWWCLVYPNFGQYEQREARDMDSGRREEIGPQSSGLI